MNGCRLSLSLMFLFATPGGCASQPEPTRAEVVRQVQQTQANAAATDLVAMRPFLGMWSVDHDATLAQNADLPQDFRDELSQDLKRHPFDLELTPRDYISRSWAKTRHDTYTIDDVIKPGLVILNLKSAAGEPAGGNRHVKLHLRDGKLFINVNGGRTTVMSRASPSIR